MIYSCKMDEDMLEDGFLLYETEVRSMSKSISEPLPNLKHTLDGHKYNVCLALIY